MSRESIPDVGDLLPIEPDRLYSPLETALLLGMESNMEDERLRRRSLVNRVYGVVGLRKTRMGPTGGRTVYRGRSILELIESRTEAA